MKQLIFITLFLFSMCFSTGSQAAWILKDTITPGISEKDVPVNTSVSVSFSQDMNAATINENTFYVGIAAEEDTGFPSTEVIQGQPAYDAGTRTATWTPASGSLDFEKQYFVTIEGGSSGVKDTSGGQLEKVIGDVFMWGFFTTPESGSDLPEIVSTTPAEDATEISLTTTISVTFSKSADISTCTADTFFLKNGTESVTGSITQGYVDTMVIFTPASDLDYDTLYDVTLTEGIRDTEGIPLQSSYTWSFTTIPDPAPFVTGTTPTSDASGIATDITVTAAFSEEIAASGINKDTFTVRSGSDSITGTVTYSDGTAAFKPEAELGYDTLCTATITAGVKDLAGNPMETDHVWSFTTKSDTDPPFIIPPTSPPDGATGVSVELKEIRAEFSEEVKASTLNSDTFKLHDGAGDISGSVNYDNLAAVFEPSEQLQHETVYTVRITTGVEDIAGNTLEDEYTWSFTTGAECSEAAKGDINNDGNTDLHDAIVAFQVCIEEVPFYNFCTEADINGDGKIGIEEIIYILNFISD
ncbi:Ig-like domain-containing protein [Desulfococcaceae bacterium HSG8]|nr:Ig-like domain-containing protein [Desulfococcaceae bacterium HSG8]